MHLDARLARPASGSTGRCWPGLRGYEGGVYRRPQACQSAPQDTQRQAELRLWNIGLFGCIASPPVIRLLRSRAGAAHDACTERCDDRDASNRQQQQQQQQVGTRVHRWWLGRCPAGRVVSMRRHCSRWLPSMRVVVTSLFISVVVCLAVIGLRPPGSSPLSVTDGPSSDGDNVRGGDSNSGRRHRTSAGQQRRPSRSGAMWTADDHHRNIHTHNSGAPHGSAEI